MSTSYTNSCFPIALQSVKDAISKDAQGDSKEAYNNYLSCMLFMLQAMKNDAWEKKDIQELCSEETFRLLKLTDQCFGRIKDILDNGKVPKITSSSPRHLAGRRVSEPPHYTKENKTNKQNANALNLSNSLNAMSLLNSLPSPPGAIKANTLGFQHHNQERFQAYQRRKTLSGARTIGAKYNTTNYNLDLFRKQAEKKALTLAKEKVFQQRRQERQEEIKLEAEKRWNLRNNRSQRDKEYRKNLLAEIMTFEEHASWPKEHRDCLREHASDITVIIQVVQTALRNKDHPLARVCKGLQYVVYQKSLEILNQSRSNETYLNPVDTIPRPRLPMTGRVQNTGQRDKRYSTSGGDDYGFSFCQGDDVKMEDASEEKKDNDYDVPGSTDSKTDPLESQGSISDEPGANNGTTGDSSTFDEKIYNDLEGEMFSSTDDDEGDDDEDRGDVSHADDETEEVETHPEAKDSVRGSNNPSYFSLNRSRENFALYNRDLPSDDVASNDNYYEPYDSTTPDDTYSTIENNDYDEPFDATAHEGGSGKATNKSESTYEVIWEEKDPSKKTKQDENTQDRDNDEFNDPDRPLSSVSIQVIPDTPRDDKHDDDAPLPDHFSASGSGGDSEYSDIGEEFEDNKYEALATEIVKPPGYYDRSDGSGNDKKTEKSEKIGNDTYESLSFDNNDENFYEELDTLKDGATSNDVSSSSSSFSPSSENATEEGNYSQLIPVDTFYLKKLDAVIQEIRFGIDRLHSVLLLAYEDLDTPVGRDQSYATLESILFQPLWPWLLQAFRKINEHKEEYLMEIFEQYKDCKPQDLKVGDKFALCAEKFAKNVPYQEAICEIQQLANLRCPLDKLECLVRMSKAVCHCVEEFWLKERRAGHSPAVSGDDLLPIVSFVIVKTNYPQIISECHAMEEFIHEGYLMGEEGYCLTTLHAAISYLLSMKKNMPSTRPAIEGNC